ncbi:uncharacterized protein [Amphiura filiformis]|uniref:uncharacterized protein n=1 Tax=Amphiura filiformis TaxID=82378 RepID=UPI003B21509C
MEWLEQEALATAHLDIKPRLWKRYVDDVLEIVNKGSAEPLTEHLNQIDKTGNIKFAYETEENQQIPFLDTLIVKKPDGSIKLLFYRKKTHTDQYLHFQSHHPLQHKLSVIRTLMDRKDKVVTEEKDRELEEVKIKEALARCGYPERAFKTVLKPSKPKVNSQSQSKSRGFVCLPYKQGLSEKTRRIFQETRLSSEFQTSQNVEKPSCPP